MNCKGRFSRQAGQGKDMLNTKFWDNEGAGKVFTHPICPDRLAGVDRNVSILDFGCGYGRLTPLLLKEGFSDIVGYDPSAALIARAIRENPGARYTCDDGSLETASFDLILCVAVFTSCPVPEDQHRLAGQIDAVARDKSLLYLSDLEIVDNPNYQKRYQERKIDIYGCFSSGNGIFRHHETGHFDRLLPGWRMMTEKTVTGKTLNGNDITIHQYLYEKKDGRENVC